jgi:hypothetical protein
MLVHDKKHDPGVMQLCVHHLHTQVIVPGRYRNYLTLKKYLITYPNLNAKS